MRLLVDIWLAFGCLVYWIGLIYSIIFLNNTPLGNIGVGALFFFIWLIIFQIMSWIEFGQFDWWN